MSMIDDERLIEQIRQLLDLVGEPPAERVEALATDYNERCEQVNARLRECSQRLRQGLRSEALQLAQHEPNALERLSILDFAERGAFVELCLQADVSPPPKLLADVAERLQDAAETERNLGALLRKHRLLALARSPLSRRVAALRQIQQADGANPIWQRDLLKYEQTRQQQIQAEAEGAFRAGDVSTVVTLEQEVIGSPWSHKPSAALVEWVQRARGQLQSLHAQAELKQLAPRLIAAHEARDLATGQTLRDRWEACVALLRGQALPAETEPARAALAWLEQDRQRQELEASQARVIAELAAGLDEGLAVGRLDRLYREALKLETPLPAELADRYHGLRAAARRSTALRWSAIAATIMILAASLGGAVWTGMYYVRQSQEVAEQVDEAQRLIEQGRLDEALLFVESRLEAGEGLPGRPAFLALASRVRGLQTRQLAQRDEVRTALARIEEAAHFEQPTLADLSAAEKLVPAAEALEKNSAEIERLAQLVRSIHDHRQRIQESIEQQFRNELQTLAERQAAQELDASVTAEGAASLLTALKQLRARSGQVTPEQVARIDQLLAKQLELQRLAGLRESQRRALDRLARAVPNLAAYRQALVDYNEQFADTPRAAHFQTAQRESSLWESIQRWNQLIDRWRGFDGGKLPPGLAETLLKESQAVLDDELAASLPSAEQLRERLDYLRSVVAREADQRALVRQMQTLLNDSTLSGLRMVRVVQNDKPRELFTVSAPTLLPGDLVRVTYVTGFELTTKNLTVPRSQILPAAAGGALDALAPQALFAQRALKNLAGLNVGAGWEATWCDLCEATQADKEMDPLVRLMLLDRFLATACEGSSVVQHSLGPVREQIAASGVVLTVNWLNPDDAVAVLERQKAIGVLERLPAIAPLRGEIERELAQLQTPLGTRYEWIGCLLKEESAGGVWRCAAEALPATDGELVVVIRDREPGPATIVKIGTLRQGKAIVEPAAHAGLSEGRAVFVSLSRGSDMKTAAMPPRSP